MNSAYGTACLILASGLVACSHGLPVPSYDEVVMRHQALKGGYPEIARSINYGNSVEGRILSAFRIAKLPLTEPAESALIIGAIHGDEYMNIVDRLGEWFLGQSDAAWFRNFLDAGRRIYILPIANPDGFENWRTHRFRPRRRNANRVDLNRDFDAISLGEKRLTQPETRYLVELLEREQAIIRLVINYHCCAGALGYPGGHYQLSLPDSDKQRHIEIARELHKILWGDIVLGDWKSIVDYTGTGNATDYFYERYRGLSYLYEGHPSEHNLFARHTEAWRYLLNRMMRDR
ncbi:MAG: M14 family metallopeptidase [Gammaproteobacteria bacterium]|nr:M14 family metallopeptidase [Gammaproteobacteria bacterium]